MAINPMEMNEEIELLCDIDDEFYCTKRDLIDRECIDGTKENIENYVKTLKDRIVLPVYVYEHSGIILSTKPIMLNTKDSYVGYITAPKEPYYNEAFLETILQELTAWVNGEVYMLEYTDFASKETHYACEQYNYDHDACKDFLKHEVGLTDKDIKSLI